MTTAVLTGKRRRAALALVVGASFALSAACTSRVAPASSPAVQVSAAPGPISNAAPPGSGTAQVNPDAGPLTLLSTAFISNGLIPVNFSCAGENTSPPLTWHGAAPAGTTTWAIVMQDLDVKPGPWVQWMVTGIPVATRGVSTGQTAPGSITRRVSNSTVGFVGMCPPAGKVHHYRFTLYADRAQVSLPASASAAQVLTSIKKGAVGTAVLDGRFAR